MRNKLFAAAFLVCAAAPAAAAAADLRVCADPNNLPFSNRAGQGFENKIAVLLARDLDEKPVLVFQRQTENFLDRGLKMHLCDVVMGVPAGLDEVAVTKPYYASTYVFVTRRSEKPLASLRDPRLRRLKIGVHLIGDEAAPPVEALGREGIVDNVKGFMIDGGDYAKPNPPARLIEAVADGQIDVAAVWGPVGGYFAKASPVALTVTPMTGTNSFTPLVFQFAIAAGVRKQDRDLRTRLDAVLTREQGPIQAILKSYGVPLVSPEGLSHE
jgi:quinoprotein dehydrogenase-associated probable ABC transporter substrate-binding protein